MRGGGAGIGLSGFEGMPFISFPTSLRAPSPPQPPAPSASNGRDAPETGFRMAVGALSKKQSAHDAALPILQRLT